MFTRRKNLIIKKEHIFAAEYIESAPVETKVYIIDDGDHTTMLLTEEY